MVWKADVYQMEFIHPNLKNLLRFYEDKIGIAATITSLYRIGDPGPHGQLPLRAVDLRYVPGESERGEQLVNTHWTYDPERPGFKVAILHDAGSGLHLHLQVHRNTRRT